MYVHQETVTIQTRSREELYDITPQVLQAVADSGIETGICSVYAQGATAAIMIQENWDSSVQNDVISLLRKIIPNGVWEHDRQDGNGDSHLKSGLIGPGETVPVTSGSLALSRWQNIFFCEFDGPRRERNIRITVIGE